MDELKHRLRQAAHAHQPDRARILARVERGMAAAAPAAAYRPAAGRPWPRVAGALTAVAAVLLIGGHMTAAMLHDHAPARTVSTPSAAERLRADGVVDPHSNRFWAQNNLTLRNNRPLTSLTVALRIVRTAGVASTGHWRTLPEADFTVSVRQENGRLVYTWTLRPGRTVPPGRHVFAAQYNHAEGGRDAHGDRYTVTATTRDGREATVRGDFVP
ncbi:hypothetical protein [Streptomyces sp. NPDC006368]|uniref:hypothetical protein n=1 Tax=Streptomyces sp. NPDC006368 TaxID=3156760 RepID=UPI0033AD7DF6